MAFTLDIRTPAEPVFEGEVRSLVAPGTEGYLGVLSNHAPLITALAAGELRAQLEDGSQRGYFLSGGFLEVSHNRAIVLADELEPLAELDAASAAQELDALREARGTRQDVAQAEQEIARARARLRAARKRRGERP